MTEINFKGKEFVYNHHLAVPFRTLVPHKEKGIGSVALDGNLIIHGDNLHALKALLPYYAGKIDCIYIDPPYNTGKKEWSYRDDVNAPMIQSWFDDNPISHDDGLKHDKWCAMMWPRLRILDGLLSPEGLVFISINSIEFHHLKGMCDEIFGEDRYIGEFVWKSRNNKDNRNEDGLSNDHEYVLIYGGGLDGELRSAADYTNPDSDNRGPWTSANMVGLATKEKRPNLHYDLIDPATGKNYGCPNKGWRFESSTMARLIEERKVLWPQKDKGRPRRKAFLSELDARTNVSSVISGKFYTNNGTNTFENIMPGVEFPFPKPIELIQFILSCFERDDLLILDSFAGSASTAQAVMAANDLDAGSRRFILVELEDYANQLTAERVRRVIKGYKYKGKKRTELLRQRITWTRLQRADKIIESVEKIEKEHGKKYDRINKTIKDGELIVSGEKTVNKSVKGLGGSFTYCTLDDPVEMDKVLSGKTLPSFTGLGAVLFQMATNQALNPNKIREKDYYLGSASGQHLWLLYKPELEWLKTPEAALTLSRAREIAAYDRSSRHLVFAPARYVSQKMLTENNLMVEFVPLPFALYRIDRS